jgi:hypothetical protein
MLLCGYPPPSSPSPLSSPPLIVLCSAEEAGDVARYLVPRVRAVPSESNTLMGGIRSTYIQYLTKPKAYRQILEVRGRLLAGAVGQ